MIYIVNRKIFKHFKSVIGLPIDSKRFDVEPKLIDDYNCEFDKNIGKVYQYFFFNSDEVDVQVFQGAPQW